MKTQAIKTQPVLPNFLIIGAGKSGTTSLYYYLKQHPDIFMSSIKEPKFFSARSEHPGLGLCDALNAINVVGSFTDYCGLFAKGVGHVQSVILTLVFLGIGFQTFLIIFYSGYYRSKLKTSGRNEF